MTMRTHISSLTAAQLLGEVSAHLTAVPVRVGGAWEPGQGREVAHSDLLDPLLCPTLDRWGFRLRPVLYRGADRKGVSRGGHDDDDKLTWRP